MLTAIYNGLLPTVFSDEWLYSSSARLQSLSESVTPSYLYLHLFKTTNYCGSDFLSCARILNSIFFSFASIFIYLIARKYCTKKISLYIAVISLLSPINSYTAYFMPEAMYYFFFWLFAWFALTPSRPGSGIILAIMSTIKMHALFLLPALMIYKRKFFSIIITFLIFRLLLGYLFAGKTGLTLTGIKYDYNVLSALNYSHLKIIFQNIHIPLLNHFSALILMFGVPLLFIFKNKKSDIMIFTLSCVIFLVFITAFTTVQIDGWNVHENINRIHMRYYNFIFPLFYIIAAMQEGLPPSARWHSFQSWILIGFIPCAVALLMQNHNISFIDSPELFGMLYNHKFFIFLSALSAICLIAGLLREKCGARLYLFLFLPLFLITSLVFVNTELLYQRFYSKDAYDRAGQFIHDFSNIDTSTVLIIGEETAGLYKTKFYIDNIHTRIYQMPLSMPMEFAKIPEGIKWILMIGDYPALNKPDYKIAMNGYSLLHLPTQKLEKILPSKSSAVNSPVISDNACCASRKSSAANSPERFSLS